MKTKLLKILTLPFLIADVGRYWLRERLTMAILAWRLRACSKAKPAPAEPAHDDATALRASADRTGSALVILRTATSLEREAARLEALPDSATYLSAIRRLSRDLVQMLAVESNLVRALLDDDRALVATAEGLALEYVPTIERDVEAIDAWVQRFYEAD